MKKVSIYLIIIFTALFYFGCDNPAPTELFQDAAAFEDPLEIEVITKDPDDPSYSNGFDTTGVAVSLDRFTNFILVNGTRVTAGPFTEELSFVKAVFFDKNFPVYDPLGNLIGYATRMPGILKINGHTARHLPFIIKYRSGSGAADTTLGMHYVLFNKRGNQQNDPFIFPYSSIVNFQFIPVIGDQVNFNFPTPPQITGNINLSGRRINKNLRLEITWNRSDFKNIDIIIGAINSTSKSSFPIYKLKTLDDGKVIIPINLLNEIPRNRFDKIVFSLVRRIEFLHHEGADELYLLSQSIHSIIIDIP